LLGPFLLAPLAPVPLLVVICATSALVAPEAAFGVQAEIGIVPQVAASAPVGWVLDVGSLVVVNEPVVVEPRRVSPFPAVLEQPLLGPFLLAPLAPVPLLVVICATSALVAPEAAFGVQAEIGIVPQVAASAPVGWVLDVGSLVVVNEPVVIEPRRVSPFPAVLEQPLLGPVLLAPLAPVPLLVVVRATSALVAPEAAFGVQAEVGIVPQVVASDEVDGFVAAHEPAVADPRCDSLE